LEQARAQVVKMQKAAATQFTQNILQRAELYRDDEGRAHPKVLLEWLGQVLTCKSVGEGEAIKLEDSSDIGQVHAYYRQAAAWLAENLPGTVPMQAPGTAPDKDKKIEDSSVELEVSEEDRKEIRSAWALVP
jgi:hypothetical protein